jgi:hypothetical protein
MKRMIALLFALAALSVRALAGSVSLYAENDVFHNRDYDYTHGTKLSYGMDDGWDYFLWQGIYTPQDKTNATVQPGDRPYAGWLALGASKEYEWRSLWHVTEFSAGVVGPSSMSEESQKNVHRMIGSGLPNGWDDQLHDEPALTARHETRKAYWVGKGEYVSAAVVPQGEVVVGTVMDYVGLGGDFVFGYRPNPYARTQIMPKGEGRYSLYGFAGVRGRAVAWNMLLDGNMYHDSPSVEKETFVGDFQCGACISTPWAAITFTDVYRSREFETQDHGEHFGCVMLTSYF